MDKKVVCDAMFCTICGKEMLKYPEAYLCLKCDSYEVSQIAKRLYNRFLERRGINSRC